MICSGGKRGSPLAIGVERSWILSLLTWPVYVVTSQDRFLSIPFICSATASKE